MGMASVTLTDIFVVALMARKCIRVAENGDASVLIPTTIQSPQLTEDDSGVAIVKNAYAGVNMIDW